MKIEKGKNLKKTLNESKADHSPGENQNYDRKRSKNKKDKEEASKGFWKKNKSDDERIEEVKSQVEINDEKNEKINLSKIEIDDIFLKINKLRNQKEAREALKKKDIRKKVIEKKKK